jgi:hypothetical protein
MNRNKLIEAFTSNLSNAIIHNILEKAIDKEEIAERYSKEIKNSWEIAKKYREKINPINNPLPLHDLEDIKRKITNKVNSELNLRINKGYNNINLSLVKEIVDKSLKELRVVG